jgi:hypothetical protein
MKHPVFDFCSFAKASEIACADPKNVFVCVGVCRWRFAVSSSEMTLYKSNGVRLR